MSNQLTLEQFVLTTTGTNGIRISSDLTEDDYTLALCTYAGPNEYPADMSNEEQFIYALLILEAEGR